jgi:hypothetical protein
MKEMEAFRQIQKTLIGLLDSGNVIGAKNLVRHIASFWNIKGKVFLYLSEIVTFSLLFILY